MRFFVAVYKSARRTVCWTFGSGRATGGTSRPGANLCLFGPLGLTLKPSFRISVTL